MSANLLSISPCPQGPWPLPKGRWQWPLGWQVSFG